MRKIDKSAGLTLLAASMKSATHPCPLCAIAQSQVPHIEVLCATARHLVILDNFAARRGHVLVLPKEHHECITELSQAAFVELHNLAWQAGQAMTRVYSPHRVWVASLGSHTTLPTSCPHAHVHVLPITEDGDESRPAHVLSWSTSLFVYEPGEAAQVAAQLRAAWPTA